MDETNYVIIYIRTWLMHKIAHAHLIKKKKKIVSSKKNSQHLVVFFYTRDDAQV